MQKGVSIARIQEFSEPDFTGEIWIKELRYAEEKNKVALCVSYKDEELASRFFVADSNGKNKHEINSENFRKFNETAIAELPALTEKRLKIFLEEIFRQHKGILGGIVSYRIISKVYSPNKRKIAFMVQGEDGHAIFNSGLYVADNQGRNITKIDSSPGEMCKDIVWLSDSNIIYAKDLSLWQARIK